MIHCKHFLALIGLVGVIILGSSSVVNAAAECKKTKLGADYHGVISYTINGLTCQTWASQEPHKHDVFTHFPEGSEEAAKNYCRNPDNTHEGPWCYTTDPKVRWEHCDVKPCDECRKGTGSRYSGVISKTVSGRTCQNWVSQEPHKHEVITNFPEGCEKAAKNFCRNPDNTAGGPWCYTTDPKVRWEHCDVKPCECKVNKAGTAYSGTVSRTVNEIQCQNWTSQTPQKHDRITNFPEGSEEAAKNYCRNPDNTAGGPWCYTTDSKVRWEFCDVKPCDCKVTTVGSEYAGTMSRTVTGRACQQWTSQAPQKHDKLTKFPEGNEEAAKNYCRNPDDTAGGPWCYTTDPNVRWEFCPVQFC